MGKGICLSLLLCLGRPVASPGPVLALGPTHSWWGWDWGIFWGAHIYGSLEFPSTDESYSSNLLICLLSFSFPVMLEKGKVMPSVDLACCLEAGRVVSLSSWGLTAVLFIPSLCKLFPRSQFGPLGSSCDLQQLWGRATGAVVRIQGRRTIHPADRAEPHPFSCLG